MTFLETIRDSLSWAKVNLPASYLKGFPHALLDSEDSITTASVKDQLYLIGFIAWTNGLNDLYRIIPHKMLKEPALLVLKQIDDYLKDEKIEVSPVALQIINGVKPHEISLLV